MANKTPQTSKARRPTSTERSSDGKPKTSAASETKSAQVSAGTVHGAGETQWWFDARGTNDAKLLAAVEKSNCVAILIDPDQQKRVKSAKQLVVYVERVNQLENLADGIWVFTPKEEIRQKAKDAGRKTGLFIDVEDLESEFPYCVEVCRRGDDFVVIDIEHATYIPYEQLLVETEGLPTRILRSVPIKELRGTVDEINQSLNAFATMERGVGVLFRSQSVEAIESLGRNLAHRQSSKMDLVTAKVEDVQHTGLGHRVCVDTTTLMTAEEGMIIGSTGWGGIFVCSETHYLPHMNLREFRVNAGGVHSYIWGPDKHLYLSEMKAGSEVLAVDIHGGTRMVTVGRAKIERRPLLRIRCSVSMDQITNDDVRQMIIDSQRACLDVTPKGEKIAVEDQNCVYINTFLQNDWHVRIMGADGKIRHTTLIKPGDELLAHVDVPGRHMGGPVTEHIFEK